MKKLFSIIIIMNIIFVLNAANVAPGTHTQSSANNNDAFRYLCSVLSGATAGDLQFCLNYIKNSAHSKQQIADFIMTWSADAHKKQIPSVFRSKLDRIITRLRSVDYEQLIIDIDLVRNSQLTIDDMVKIIKGTRLYRTKN